jgi:hypothetical protein
MKLTLSLCFLLLCALSLGQTQRHDPCDQQVTFCWYGPYEDGSDEVTAWGEKWASPQDSAEKVMDVHTAIRCVKKMKVCLKSATHNIGGKPITNIEILPVKSWSAQQITADMEDQLDPCEKDSYIISKLDRTVLLISSPGPRADSSGCTGVLGKPKTVVFKLQ